MATAPQALVPGWAQALGEHQQAPLSMAVTATHENLAHRGEVRFGGPLTTSTLRRFKTELNADGARIAAAVDPASEFCVAPADHVWSLVRRMLPPRPELRCPPRQTPQDRRQVVNITASSADIQRALQGDVPLAAIVPDHVRALVDTETTVTLVASTLIEAGEPTQTRLLRSAHFALMGSHLRQLGLEDGRAAVTTVEPGAVGFAVLWMIEGLLTAASQAERMATR